MSEIVNRIANSELITIDLEDYYPKGQRSILDIRQWLFQDLILKEKEFRVELKSFDWDQYKGHYVALICSTDAIIPSWAYMLIATYLTPVAKKVIAGDLKALESSIFQDVVSKLPTDPYLNKPVIIKGCANKPIPDSAYLQLIEKLQPIVKSIMFGESCSTVPLFKMKRS